MNKLKLTIWKLQYMIKERLDMYERNKGKLFAYRYLLASRELTEYRIYYKMLLRIEEMSDE